MKDWLHPINAKYGRSFMDSSGNPYPDESFATFKEMLKGDPLNSFRIVKFEGNPLEVGDRLWAMYTPGFGAHGVVGLATVQRCHTGSPMEAPILEVEWNPSVCDRLASNPVSFEQVDKYFPERRWKSYIDLDDYPDLKSVIVKAGGI